MGPYKKAPVYFIPITHSLTWFEMKFPQQIATFHASVWPFGPILETILMVYEIKHCVSLLFEPK